MGGVIEYIIVQLVPIVLTLAFLVFVWGLAMYLFNQSDKEVRANAESIMFKGVITVILTTVVLAILIFLERFL